MLVGVEAVLTGNLRIPLETELGNSARNGIVQAAIQRAEFADGEGGFALKGQILAGDFIYSRYRLAMLAAAVAAVAALWYLLQRTPFGRVVRAGVQNPDMVAALGISLAPYMSGVVAISVALAALAGVLLAPITGVHPAMGAEILTASFVVVVIGGLGSFWGVVYAALIVSVVRGLTAYFFPPAAESSMYLLMLLVLLFRPRGLFGERIVRFE